MYFLIKPLFQKWNNRARTCENMSHLYDSVWERLSANQHCVPWHQSGASRTNRMLANSVWWKNTILFADSFILVSRFHSHDFEKKRKRSYNLKNFFLRKGGVVGGVDWLCTSFCVNFLYIKVILKIFLCGYSDVCLFTILLKDIEAIFLCTLIMKTEATFACCYSAWYTFTHTHTPVSYTHLRAHETA